MSEMHLPRLQKEPGGQLHQGNGLAEAMVTKMSKQNKRTKNRLNFIFLIFFCRSNHCFQIVWVKTQEHIYTYKNRLEALCLARHDYHYLSV
jgi:hypothetical protein